MCLPSRSPETALVYEFISLSLHSNGSIRHNTFPNLPNSPFLLILQKSQYIICAAKKAVLNERNETSASDDRLFMKKASFTDMVHIS